MHVHRTPRLPFLNAYHPECQVFRCTREMGMENFWEKPEVLLKCFIHQTWSPIIHLISSINSLSWSRDKVEVTFYQKGLVIDTTCHNQLVASLQSTSLYLLHERRRDLSHDDISWNTITHAIFWSISMSTSVFNLINGPVFHTVWPSATSSMITHCNWKCWQHLHTYSRWVSNWPTCGLMAANFLLMWLRAVENSAPQLLPPSFSLSIALYLAPLLDLFTLHLILLLTFSLLPIYVRSSPRSIFASLSALHSGPSLQAPL